jgi:hypothetical protein|tara:strand:+ start:254 stop:361 length:108 start_codon:yes stop_codon:yes gene_type:complete
MIAIWDRELSKELIRDDFVADSYDRRIFGHLDETI